MKKFMLLIPAFILFIYSISFSLMDDPDIVEIICPKDPWGFSNVKIIEMSTRPFVIGELKGGKVYSWNEVDDANIDHKKETYKIVYKDIEEIIDSNLFFTTISFCLDEEDIRFNEIIYPDRFYNNEYLLPPLLVFRFLLTKNEFKKNKEYFIDNINDHLLSKNIRDYWEKSKVIYLNNLKDEISKYSLNDEDYITEKQLYEKIKIMSYYDALRLSIDSIVNIIDKVNYDDKVLPYKDNPFGYREFFRASLWRVVSELKGAYNFIYDKSPFKMYFIFYRLGENASKEIKKQMLNFKNIIPK